MRVIWCKSIEDVISVAGAHGWIFYLSRGGKHYYYLYTGVESEALCLVARTDTPIAAKYVTIGDEGELKMSERPIMPVCARVVEVEKDSAFEALLSSA